MSTLTLHPPSREFTARTESQRIEALAIANTVRGARSRLKQDLKAGRQSVIPLLVSPPPWLESMKVADLLLALPKWGRVRVAKALAANEISASKTVGGMSIRQRRALLIALGVKAKATAAGEREWEHG
jgi:S13-like protein